MNLQPTLNDDIIILRPLKADDFDGLYAVAKDPLIWEQHPCQNRYKKEVYSQFFAASLESKGALVILEKSTGKIIGSSRFNPIIGEENAIEIGWSFLSRNYWGGKYNKSMKKLMIDYAFKFVDNIIFFVSKDNTRSQKAVEKIGGIKICENHLRHLIKNEETGLTYRINKQVWV